MLRQQPHLVPGPVHERHFDTQTAEQGDVQEDVTKIGILDDGPATLSHVGEIAPGYHSTSVILRATSSSD